MPTELIEYNKDTCQATFKVFVKTDDFGNDIFEKEVITMDSLKALSKFHQGILTEINKKIALIVASEKVEK